MKAVRPQHRIKRSRQHRHHVVKQKPPARRQQRSSASDEDGDVVSPRADRRATVTAARTGKKHRIGLNNKNQDISGPSQKQHSTDPSPKRKQRPTYAVSSTNNIKTNIQAPPSNAAIGKHHHSPTTSSIDRRHDRVVGDDTNDFVVDDDGSISDSCSILSSLNNDDNNNVFGYSNEDLRIQQARDFLNYSHDRLLPGGLASESSIIQSFRDYFYPKYTTVVTFRRQRPIPSVQVLPEGKEPPPPFQVDSEEMTMKKKGKDKNAKRRSDQRSTVSYSDQILIDIQNQKIVPPIDCTILTNDDIVRLTKEWYQHQTSNGLLQFSNNEKTKTPEATSTKTTTDHIFSKEDTIFDVESLKSLDATLTEARKWQDPSFHSFIQHNMRKVTLDDANKQEVFVVKRETDVENNDATTTNTTTRSNNNETDDYGEDDYSQLLKEQITIYRGFHLNPKYLNSYQARQQRELFQIELQDDDDDELLLLPSTIAKSSKQNCRTHWSDGMVKEMIEQFGTMALREHMATVKKHNKRVEKRLRRERRQKKPVHAEVPIEETIQVKNKEEETNHQLVPAKHHVKRENKKPKKKSTKVKPKKEEMELSVELSTQLYTFEGPVAAMDDNDNGDDAMNNDDSFVDSDLIDEIYDNRGDKGKKKRKGRSSKKLSERQRNKNKKKGTKKSGKRKDETKVNESDDDYERFLSGASQAPTLPTAPEFDDPYAAPTPEFDDAAPAPEFDDPYAAPSHTTATTADLDTAATETKVADTLNLQGEVSNKSQDEDSSSHYIYNDVDDDGEIDNDNDSDGDSDESERLANADAKDSEDNSADSSEAESQQNGKTRANDSENSEENSELEHDGESIENNSYGSSKSEFEKEAKTEVDDAESSGDDSKGHIEEETSDSKHALRKSESQEPKLEEIPLPPPPPPPPPVQDPPIPKTARKQLAAVTTSKQGNPSQRARKNDEVAVETIEQESLDGTFTIYSTDSDEDSVGAPDDVTDQSDGSASANETEGGSDPKGIWSPMRKESSFDFDAVRSPFRDNNNQKLTPSNTYGLEAPIIEELSAEIEGPTQSESKEETDSNDVDSADEDGNSDEEVSFREHDIDDEGTDSNEDSSTDDDDESYEGNFDIEDFDTDSSSVESQKRQPKPPASSGTTPVAAGDERPQTVPSKSGGFFGMKRLGKMFKSSRAVTPRNTSTPNSKKGPPPKPSPKRSSNAGRGHKSSPPIKKKKNLPVKRKSAVPNGTTQQPFGTTGPRGQPVPGRQPTRPQRPPVVRGAQRGLTGRGAPIQRGGRGYPQRVHSVGREGPYNPTRGAPPFRGGRNTQVPGRVPPVMRGRGSPPQNRFPARGGPPNAPTSGPPPQRGGGRNLRPPGRGTPQRGGGRFVPPPNRLPAQQRGGGRGPPPNGLPTARGGRPNMVRGAPPQARGRHAPSAMGRGRRGPTARAVGRN